MDKIGDLTEAKLREWQTRRLEVKDRMQSHPEKTLELSKVLDLMDEEHAAILGESTANQMQGAVRPNPTPEKTSHAKPSLRPVAGKFELQLHVAASSPDDLRKLLEMAVYELQRQIDAQASVTGERISHSGGMSGTLGGYHFELGLDGGVNHG